MMAQFGCAVSFDGKTYVIEAGSKYQPETYQIEPDVSAACYFMQQRQLPVEVFL